MGFGFKRQNKSEPRDLKRWAAVLLVLLALGLILIANQIDIPTAKKKKQNPVYVPRPGEKAVNKYLQWTHRKMDLETQRREVENYYMAPKIGQTLALPTKAMNWGGADLEQEKDLEKLQRDLDPKAFSERDEKSPQQAMEGELYDQQKMREWNDFDRAQYVDEFIRNARAHGYEIKVDSNFVVTEVHKLPQGPRGPASPSETSSSGSD